MAQVSFRPERAEDFSQIRQLLIAAFERTSEADLVEALRRDSDVSLALVAEIGEQIVGHVLFSPVTIEAESQGFDAVGLGPVAVLPQYQKQGIGAQLIQSALQVLRERGERAVVVLGHPEYYPRFGFRTAKYFDVRCEFEVPDEAFMLLELQPDALNGVTGVARYAPAFRSVT
jgi:putative acetyltransferase